MCECARCREKGIPRASLPSIGNVLRIGTVRVTTFFDKYMYILVLTSCGWGKERFGAHPKFHKEMLGKRERWSSQCHHTHTFLVADTMARLWTSTWRPRRYLPACAAAALLAYAAPCALFALLFVVVGRQHVLAHNWTARLHPGRVWRLILFKVDEDKVDKDKFLRFIAPHEDHFGWVDPRDPLLLHDAGISRRCRERVECVRARSIPCCAFVSRRCRGVFAFGAWSSEISDVADTLGSLLRLLWVAHRDRLRGGRALEQRYGRAYHGHCAPCSVLADRKQDPISTYIAF